MYRYLYGRLRQLGYDQEDLGLYLGLSRAAISRRFTGAVPWTMAEAHKVLEFCRAKPEEVWDYFPPVSLLKPKKVVA